jgi:hypothetical protein
VGTFSLCHMTQEIRKERRRGDRRGGEERRGKRIDSV